MPRGRALTWTQEDFAILKANWFRGPAVCRELLPGKSRQTIYHWANKLGLVGVGQGKRPIRKDGSDPFLARLKELGISPAAPTPKVTAKAKGGGRTARGNAPVAPHGYGDDEAFARQLAAVRVDNLVTVRPLVKGEPDFSLIGCSAGML